MLVCDGWHEGDKNKETILKDLRIRVSRPCLMFIRRLFGDANGIYIWKGRAWRAIELLWAWARPLVSWSPGGRRNCHRPDRQAEQQNLTIATPACAPSIQVAQCLIFDVSQPSVEKDLQHQTELKRQSQKIQQSWWKNVITRWKSRQWNLLQRGIPFVAANSITFAGGGSPPWDGFQPWFRVSKFVFLAQTWILLKLLLQCSQFNGNDVTYRTRADDGWSGDRCFLDSNSFAKIKKGCTKVQETRRSWTTRARVSLSLESQTCGGDLMSSPLRDPSDSCHGTLVFFRERGKSCSCLENVLSGGYLLVCARTASVTVFSSQSCDSCRQNNCWRNLTLGKNVSAFGMQLTHVHGWHTRMTLCGNSNCLHLALQKPLPIIIAPNSVPAIQLRNTQILNATFETTQSSLDAFAAPRAFEKCDRFLFCRAQRYCVTHTRTGKRQNWHLSCRCFDGFIFRFALELDSTKTDEQVTQTLTHYYDSCRF